MINFATDMKISLNTKRSEKPISNRITNVILAMVAGILALLCVLSIVQH